jgi:hypothetical protein
MKGLGAGRKSRAAQLGDGVARAIKDRRSKEDAR